MAAVPVLVGEQEFDAFKAGDARTLLDSATAAARRFCRWHVAPVLAETLRVRGNGGRTLMLPTLNVADVTAVVVTARDLAGVDGLSVATYVAGVDYTWTTDGALVRVPVGGIWPAGGVVDVTLQHGYPIADVADVRQVIAARVARAQASPGGASRVQVGPFDETYATAGGWTPDEVNVLRAYQLAEP